MPTAAKKSRNRPVLPGIAVQVIQKLKQTRQASVVDLGLFRQARELALQQRGEASEDLSDLHPFHAAATYVLKTVVSAANLIGELPELSRLMIASMRQDTERQRLAKFESFVHSTSPGARRILLGRFCMASTFRDVQDTLLSPSVGRSLLTCLTS